MSNVAISSRSGKAHDAFWTCESGELLHLRSCIRARSSIHESEKITRVRILIVATVRVCVVFRFPVVASRHVGLTDDVIWPKEP